MEIKEFDAMRIRNVSVQYDDKEVENFQCAGSITGETEMREIVKRCEGVARKTRQLPIKHNLTLTGYVPVVVLRRTYGLSNEDLAEGVYSYGIDSQGEDFVLTADVIDEFENTTKLVAFPNATTATGLTFTVDNDEDEVAYVELEFVANPDDQGKFYYEAFSGEVSESIKKDWHEDFSYDLVKEPNV